MRRLLITFGCSWTFGVCSGYTAGMSKKDLLLLSLDSSLNDRLSFRGLLSKKYNLTNKNFASGGSSNQRQFRLAKEFFSSDEFVKLHNEFDEVIVLWGITSTARNEMWSLELGNLHNFFYNDSSLLSKALVKYQYNHEHEITQLAMEMQHWNMIFKNLNVKNLWFDTFNHHSYHIPGPRIEKFKKEYNTFRGPDWPDWEDFARNEFKVADEIRNELLDKSRQWGWTILFPSAIQNLMFNDENPRDLLSKLAINHGIDELDGKYHKSDWSIDSNRIEYLTKCGILNPHSTHPTQQGHLEIADMLSDYIEAVLQ